MANQITLEQLMQAIEALKAKMPNGELTHIKNSVEELRSNYSGIKQDLSDIKMRLLNPEDGLVVRNNQNRDRVVTLDEDVTTLYETVNQIDDDVRDLKGFKKNVNTALYVVYAATVGLLVNAIKNIF